MYLLQEAGRLPFLLMLLSHVTQIKFLPGTGHPYIKKPPLFFDRWFQDCFLVRHASLIYIQDIYLVIFQSFDAMER